MSQAVWTGGISFGLVNIPVKLYPATEPKDVRFQLYDRRSGKRVRYERVTRVDEPATFAPEFTAPATERVDRTVAGLRETRSFSTTEDDIEPVAREEVVRGFDLPGG